VSLRIDLESLLEFLFMDLRTDILRTRRRRKSWNL